MEKEFFRRVQISLLSVISFLGLVGHMLMFTMELPMKIALGTDMMPEVKGMLESFGGSMNGMLWMLLAFFILALLPAFIPLVLKAAWARWLTFVFALIMLAMNVMDGVTHTFIEGEVSQGLATFVIAGIPGLIATVLAFKWAREN